MRTRFNLALLVSLAALGVAIAVLEVRRERRVDEWRIQREQTDALVRTPSTADRERVLETAAKKQRSESDYEQARQELTELERWALDRRAAMQAEHVRRKAADDAALAGDNRDPEKRMAKLEHFQNVGRATPAAALQTLVWAALKGEDAALASGLAVEGRARERAEVLRRSLPESQREASTPEKLSALWFAGEILDVPAMRIADRIVDDANHVTLIVRGGIARDQKVPMQLGPDGWQVVVPERAMESIQKKVLGSSPALSKE